MAKNLILDCASVSSAYQSLEQIVQRSVDDIKSVFNNFNLDHYSTINPSDVRKPGEILLEQLMDEGCEIAQPSEIYWFHATRVLRTDSFIDGIRPLNEQIERIWNDLFTLVSEDMSEFDWKQFRGNLETQQQGHHAEIYRNRTMKNDNGPFGLLVREVAIRPEESGSVDYLKSPEIIEDICICFCDMYGKDLLELYQENSRRCIVTFTDSEPRTNALHKAIFYLYLVFRNEPLDGCNTCFDGNGTAILPEKIVRIEYLDEPLL